MVPKRSEKSVGPTRIDVANKKRRERGMNFREREAFSGICEFGPEQLIECYGNLCQENDYKNAYDFMVMCERCRHCVSRHALCCGSSGQTPIYDHFSAGSCFDGSVLYDHFEDYMDWDDPKSFVYFLDDGEFIKIGKAKNIRNRVSSIQTANARKLSVPYVIPCKSETSAFEVESYLHWLYRRYRMEGEWFKIREKIDPISFSNFEPEKEWI